MRKADHGDVQGSDGGGQTVLLFRGGGCGAGGPRSAPDHPLDRAQAGYPHRAGQLVRGLRDRGAHPPGPEPSGQEPVPAGICLPYGPSAPQRALSPGTGLPDAGGGDRLSVQRA